MAFYGYDGDADDPYTTAHGYEYSSSSHPIDYASSAYYYDYYEFPSQSGYGEPKFVQYDPPPHYQAYFPKFAISYSNVELTEAEFEEYDPTPYDGGYDQRMTYGKPLPPSDLTCYPRSLPQSQSHTPIPNFSYDSIPSPYGKDPIEPPTKRKPAPAAETETKVIGEPTNVIPEGLGGDYVPPISYGSGLEAVDLCESIFGYWPCLAKKAQQERDSCNQDTRMDPWKTAADYLFGSLDPLPYDYANYHHHHSPYPYHSDQVSWLQ